MPSDATIVVTGANGQLGRGVVEALLARVPAARIVASVRDPAGAAELAGRGVTVRLGDFTRPDTLPAAFAGVGQVLVVSPNRLGPEGVAMSRAAIAAAGHAGRVLYTSHMGTHAASPFAHHHAIEETLAAGAAPWTSLRHGFYAESALHLLGDWRRTGEIRAPEDGPVSWTSRADLAAADAAILAGDFVFDGVSPPLTAPEALTLADIARLASEASGREVRRVVVSEAEWVDAKVAGGAPRPMAELMAGVFAAMRRGDFAATGPALGELLGRPPQGFRRLLE